MLLSMRTRPRSVMVGKNFLCAVMRERGRVRIDSNINARSEEHTSELQSQSNIVCRHLLEKKIPAGVADGGKDDNIIYDITNGVSAGGFGHPECSPAATSIGKALPTTHPIGH